MIHESDKYCPRKYKQQRAPGQINEISDVPECKRVVNEHEDERRGRRCNYCIVRV
jgi:hypothetical protein